MLDRTLQQVGNYRIIRRLGRGGFADVYLGEHRYLKSAAALKILRISLSKKDAQRFLEEAQILARLRHANIVRVLDFAIEDDTPVLIMDYVPGGSLRERHPRGTPVPLAMVVDYVERIAAALQYAHNQHTIHRDIKPENILLDADQYPVLSDFGLALLAASPDLLSTQDLAGTAAYISPEQVRGRPGFASDQYALAVVTYEWITGACPFAGTAFEMMERHLSATPPPLRERCPDLPTAVEQVVLKALSKDPGDRYYSVAAFAYALRRSCQESTQPNEDPQVTVSLRAIPLPFPLASDHSHLSRRTIGRIFLSVAPGDESIAAPLVADLKRRGLLLSNDGSQKVSGQQEALREAIRSVHRVVVVVTPQTRSSRQVREHLHLAQVYQRKLVLVWMQGEGMATLLQDQTLRWFRPVDMVDARGGRYQTAFEELLVCLQGESVIPPWQATEDLMTLEVPPEPRNPYKGLRAFRQDEASDFFGREALIDVMIEQLKGILETQRRGVAGTRLLAMVGASGSGKSSAMLAGLLPQLQAGALPGSEAWVYLEPIVPGTHPLEALALTLAPHFPHRSMKAIQEDLQDDSARGLHRLSTQLIKRPDSRVVLIVDQFEELFTQTMAEAEQRCFVDLLVTAVTEVPGPVLVLLTLRADFYDRPMRYPYLYQLIEAHHQSILPMEIHELRQVIEGPADLPDVQLTFEGNLLGDLIFEAQGQVGALPLLEFALDQLFQRRDGQTLTLAAYHEMGGVKGALVRRAELTYASLPSDQHRFLTRLLFMRLVNLGATDQDTTRRRATLSELSLTDAKQTALLQEVTNTFVDARLLTANKLAGTTTIEVSHEALIAEWARLFNWLRAGREDLRFQQALSNDANAWEERKKPKDQLYRGARLKEAKAWAKRNEPSKQEVAFIHASSLRQTRSLVSLIVIFLLLFASIGAATWFFLRTPPPPPDPTLVTNLHDDGTGSLRWAIGLAEPGSTITFAPDLKGTILLKSKDLVFSQSLTIKGPGVTISGGNSGHIVQVLDGNAVTLSDLSFKDSDTGKVKVGFLYNQGILQLINTTISGNTSSGIGGGIANENVLTLINSTVSDNTAYHGGGIYNFNGTLTIINSTISGNKAISQDPADLGSGGGIYNFGQLTLTNSTVSGNAAYGAGGGITLFGSLATITFSTIYDNAAQNGGGLSIQAKGNQPSQVTIGNSIVAGNRAPVDADIVGTLTSDGHNLIQNASQASGNFAEADLIGMSPNLRALHNNGGPTQTHALVPDSSVIDAVPSEACHLDTIRTDQRGVKRPQGSACDIGAYEYEKVPSQ
jgi:serine/threonine protein kinase